MINRWAVWLISIVALLPSSASSLGASTPQQTSAGSPPSISEARALIDQYCVTCHNDKTKTAGLALNTLDLDRIGESPEVWEKVLQKVRPRYMPPIGRPRPDEAGYDKLVSYLETSLDRVAAAKPNPGRTDTFHRLNRTDDPW